MHLRRLALIAVALLVSSVALATTRYVDGSLGADCTGGDYSIANRNCTGSDGNAYNTVQEGLNVTVGGDTLYIRDGTYSGDFSCCGSGGTTVTNGTASSPTRILGYASETVTLNGTTGQTSPDTNGTYYGSTVLGTISM